MESMCWNMILSHGQPLFVMTDLSDSKCLITIVSDEGSSGN